MQEKNMQEKAAAERQVELIAAALDKAQQNGGVWLSNDGKKQPQFYQKGVVVSPFNALILGLHSDQHNYKTNQYTLFSDAKKRGESVQSKEKGVPFLWYSWNQYQNRNNPEDRITRADFQALPKEQQGDYKGIRTREVRTLFNIEQTTLPMVDKTAFAQAVKETGTISEREDVEEASAQIRTSIDDFVRNIGENLVAIRQDTTGVAQYDAKKDVILLPKQDDYEHIEDYARAVVEQAVIATGSQSRLSREGMVMKGGRNPSEDAMKQERLVVELATAVKLQELGVSAKLSSESMKHIDYWKRELQENPCLIDAVERDINNSLDMLHKAERGLKVEKQTSQGTEYGARNIIPKHFYIADEIKTLPSKDTKEIVIVRNADQKMADVIMPMGAGLGPESEISGMNKGRIEHALQNEGYDTVTFYNVDGSLGYRPDDSFFDGKDVSVARLKGWSLEDITKLDVTDAVRRSGAVDFEKVLMLRDDAGKWALYMKPENEKAFSVYPDKGDVNRFFVTLKQGNEENSDQMRQEMATKYYVMANDKPEMKIDIFKSQATAEELAKIDRVNIFKTKETADKPSVILCMPTIEGQKQKPREINQQQWQRMWLSDNIQDFKTHLAATLFADVLRQGRSDSVALGTDKSEQEAQQETKEAQHTEFHEKNEQSDAKEEQEHADYHEEKDKQKTEQEKKQEEKKNSPEQKEKEKQEEKAKEEATKAETKVVAAIALSPMLKQFIDLKKKHPDALLLFRCGDFYETYMQDAEKSSKILGITLTRSSKTKDPDGKPLAMAGFPYHALDTFLPKLIRAGQRVAICDQIEAPKQTTKRGITEMTGPVAGMEKEPKAQEEQKQTVKEDEAQGRGFFR